MALIWHNNVEKSGRGAIIVDNGVYVAKGGAYV